MSFINYSSREINCKIVYYGPGLCGKTTNLQYIYDRTNPAAKGKLISLATETDRTLFFDFLPLDLGSVRGFRTRFHLYTVPGQVFYDASRKLILKGVDGVVFVADSQEARMDANVESLRNLEKNLIEHGFDLPRRLQIEFSSVIQKMVERSGTEITADQIWAAFEATYLKPDQPLGLAHHPTVTTAGEAGETTIEAPLRVENTERLAKGTGNGPIAAFVDALRRDAGITVSVLDYNEHAMGGGADASAVAYVEAKVGDGKARWGVGIHGNIVTASLRAVVSAVNRAVGPDV